MNDDLLIIDGVIMPSPDLFDVSPGDLDSEATGRNGAGYNQRDRLREGVRTIMLGWAYLSEEDTAKILNATVRDAFDVTYMDPQYGIITKNMYAGPKEVKLVFRGHPRGSGGRELRWKVSFNLIEN